MVACKASLTGKSYCALSAKETRLKKNRNSLSYLSGSKYYSA